MGRLAAQTYAAHCANFSSSCSKLIASSGSLMLLEILLEDSERVKLKVQELMRKGDILVLTDKKKEQRWVKIIFMDIGYPRSPLDFSVI